MLLELHMVWTVGHFLLVLKQHLVHLLLKGLLLRSYVCLLRRHVRAQGVTDGPVENLGERFVEAAATTKLLVERMTCHSFFVL